MINKEEFLQNLIPALKIGAQIALRLEGKVQNDTKEVDFREGEDTKELAGRTAKTVVDEMIQETIIHTVRSFLDTSLIQIDAEEVTPGLQFFSTTPQDTTLVLDPIDGTINYIQQSGSYAIHIGVIEKGTVSISLIYFPQTDTLYYLDADGNACVVSDFYTSTYIKFKQLKSNTALEKRIYINSRVPIDMIKQIQSKGFIVEKIFSENDGLLEIINGKAYAYIAVGRHIRDALMGAITSKVADGYLTDWNGNDIIWPQSGRIPQLIVGNTPLPEELKIILKQYAN
ncbi:MAG: inositol monophosphatase family protein [Candidatus Roizmanbacteria bacterium]